MLIIPAIDIKETKVVRFTQGRYQKKVYSDNPLKIASQWQRQGAKFIHIVDLDAASSGETKIFSLLKKIIATVNTPIEFGGGVRDIATIKKLLDLGIKRVIIGTKAADDLSFIKKVFKQFGKQVIVSIDCLKGEVFTHGWRKKNKKISAINLAKKLKAIGFKQVIFTDISRDGALKGVNIPAIKRILKIGLRVIASGGVSSLQDIRKLQKLQKQGLIGVIVGKALYEEKFTLKEANQLI